MTDRHLGVAAVAASPHTPTDCPSCRGDQRELDETLAELTALAATPPPPQVRGQLLTAIREVRPLPPVLTRPRPTEADPSDPQRPASRRITAVLGLLVAAVLVVALSLGFWVHSLDQERRSDIVATSAEDRLLSAPDVRVYRSSLSGTPVSYVVSRRLDQAMLVASDLPDPGPARTYQLWRMTSSGAQPAGLITRGADVRQWLTGSLGDIDRLAVTVERSGGAVRPSSTPRALVTL